MKTLILAAIRCSLMFTAVTASLFCDRPAEAYTITLEQMGANVVATGSGAINLTGLTSLGTVNNVFASGFVAANLGIIHIGTGAFFLDQYAGFSGPASFGSGGVRSPP